MKRTVEEIKEVMEARKRNPQYKDRYRFLKIYDCNIELLLLEIDNLRRKLKEFTS